MVMAPQVIVMIMIMMIIIMMMHDGPHPQRRASTKVI